MQLDDEKGQIFLQSEVEQSALHKGFLMLGCGGVQEPTESQEDVETRSQVSSQHRSLVPRITGALPTRAHWGSSSVDPPVRDGAGAAKEALPALRALAGLPLVLAPLVSGQVRVL